MKKRTPFNAEQHELPVFSKTTQLVSLVTSTIALAVSFVPVWASINPTLQKLILGFAGLAFLLAFVMAAIFLFRLIWRWRCDQMARNQRGESLRKLVGLVIDGQFLVNPNRPDSLRSCVDTACNSHQTDPVADLLRLNARRLQVMSDWHYSLHPELSSYDLTNEHFTKRVSGLVAYYRQLGDIVRELATIRSANGVLIKDFNDVGRIAADRYNTHVRKVDDLLEEISKFNVGIGFSPLPRF